jgi:flagellar biosynthesis/type III secretory pathway chaperone
MTHQQKLQKNSTMPPPSNFTNEHSQILSSLQTVVTQQQNILGRQQMQLDNMQEQLGMLTEVATKLAVMEERRVEDKDRVSELEDRVEVMRDRVNEKFPQYDGLVEMYKSMNNKLWAALIGVVVSVILGAIKMGMIAIK